MINIIKELLSKFKIIEIVIIVLITTSLIIFFPGSFLIKLGLLSFRNKYISYISLCFVLCVAFFILEIIKFIRKKLNIKYNGISKISMDYLKKWISKDEIEFLIETFYDHNEKMFRSCGVVNFADGRKAALENQYIIYRASNISTSYTMFAYNIQPIVLKYLNTNISKGKIVLDSDRYSWIK